MNRTSVRRLSIEVGRRQALEQRDAGRPHDEDEQGAGGGAADMGPIGDTVVRADADGLQHDPKADDPIGAHRHRNDAHQHLDLGARPEHQIGRHDAGDRARRADQRNGRIGGAEHEGGRGADPAQQVKSKEPQMTERVFDIVAEDPEKPHIAGEMQPIGVHEHRGDQREVARQETGAGQFARLDRGTRPTTFNSAL